MEKRVATSAALDKRVVIEKRGGAFWLFSQPRNKNQSKKLLEKANHASPRRRPK
jgi:hypothetical protein